jgi:hypothetical protein
MKHRLLATLTAISVLGFVAPAIAKGPAIPDQFRGEWRGDLKSCAYGQHDELRLAITDKFVSFYESSGVVRAAVSRGREITMILEVSAEENLHWVAPIQFKLSHDGKRLTDTTTQLGPKTVRYRCPGK